MENTLLICRGHNDEKSCKHLEDSIRLSSELEKLGKESEMNQMNFSDDKCKQLCLGRRKANEPIQNGEDLV